MLRDLYHYIIIARSGYFDKSYYLKVNLDVLEAGVNPLLHFIKHGWKEGRKPSAVFDINFYMSQNKDVCEARINPLLHYILFGINENRKTQRQNYHNNALLNKQLDGESTTSLQQHFNDLFALPDPWSYVDLYEQTKHKHILEIISGYQLGTGLEIGCAEGHFTEKLSRHCDSLMAIDISNVALNRAKDRCHSLNNVSFLQCDVFTELPKDRFDFIICAETLYYIKNRLSLRYFSKNIVNILKDHGKLVLVHANLVSDDRTMTGFDFNEIGSQFIAQTFSKLKSLEFIRELRTDLYRVQLFQKNHGKHKRKKIPREVIVRDSKYTNKDKVATLIKWGGCCITAAESTNLWKSPEIPILAYHRISTTGPSKLSSYRVSPENFERQLAYLQRYGYKSINLFNAFELINKYKKAPRGRLVVITFDDAYKDFYTTALPLLRKYGFTATVYVPVQFIGKSAEWDSIYGTTAKVMNWDEIREAAAEGISFGSHGLSHTKLTMLDKSTLISELTISKDILSKKLNREILSLSYPYNTTNENIINSAKHCGYLLAVGGEGFLNKNSDRLLIPRQEILGHDDIDSFILKLGNPIRANLYSTLNYKARRLLRDRNTYMNI
jgi:peptidoglycan/xylan/chitin deacetylase (PgdA/CDA1 family)/2-polyprenyl-3-methyl-5-hydroxy-6-metoxy-1,4-benzoquinol methylase